MKMPIWQFIKTSNCRDDYTATKTANIIENFWNFHANPSEPTPPIAA
jgi:hypothetical protein